MWREEFATGDGSAVGSVGRSGRRRPGRVERVVTVVAGALSAVVLAAVGVSEPRRFEPGPFPTPVAAATERGDPGLAEHLATQAGTMSLSDPQAGLRLLIAAYVVAPDRSIYRLALAGAVLGEVVLAGALAQGDLGRGGPVTYAALASYGEFVVLGREGGGQVWDTYDVARSRVVRLRADLHTSVVTAAAGPSARTGPAVVVAGPDGVFGWLASGALTRRTALMTERADTIALTADGGAAVTVQGETGMLWRPDYFHPELLATIPYDRAVTSVAFAPSDRLVLAAGHDDGGVTVHRIEQTAMAGTRQALTNAGRAAVSAVAVSADASTVVAVGLDGTLAVWDLPAGAASGPAVAASGSAVAGGPGPYRVWLSPHGDYAVVAGVAGAPVVWSLADLQHPVVLLEFAVGGDPAVPGMLSADGRELVTIGSDQVLTVWGLGSIMDTLDDPRSRACALAEMTEAEWRQLVPDLAYANPCPQTGPPTLGVRRPNSPYGRGSAAVRP